MIADAALHLPTLRFTEAEADQAYEAWGANCGPGAIAAVLGMTLDELRPRLGDFERLGYVSPSLMWDILRRLDVRFHSRKVDAWPRYGLARIQWEGPWMEPAVPIPARYRFTHWVASCTPDDRPPGVFDINCMNSGGWVHRADWQRVIVPHLVAAHPRANGRWHITHSVEIHGRRLPQSAQQETSA